MPRGDKTISVNRRAYHDYAILEIMEAGVALTGTEIKSVRAGGINIRESYVRPEKREMWLLGAHIAPYAAGSRNNPDPLRARKLLLHRKQIGHLASLASQKGLTLVPLRVYIKNGRAKLEVGLAKGKRMYEKREVIAKREAERELRRIVKLEHR